MRTTMWTLVTILLLTSTVWGQDAGPQTEPLVEVTQCINNVCTFRMLPKSQADEIMRGARQRADDAMRGARQRADDAMRGARQRADDAMRGARQRADDAMRGARQRADDAMRGARQRADDALGTYNEADVIFMTIPNQIGVEVGRKLEVLDREYAVKIQSAHPDNREALGKEWQAKREAILEEWKRDTAPTPPTPSTSCPPAPPSNH